MREMTEEEKKKFQKQSNYYSVDVSPYKYKPAPEKGIQIRVTKKQVGDSPQVEDHSDDEADKKASEEETNITSP